MNQRFQSLGQFGRNGHTVYATGVISSLRQNFFVGSRVNLRVAVETSIAAV